MNASQLINQTSGEQEYYTPVEIISAARAAMPGASIDLDPASSEAANALVGASQYYTVADDGLSKPWLGRVWLNHPFGRRENPLWVGKLLDEWVMGHVWCALTITYACTSEAWFRPLLNFPQCYLSPRTNFYLADGTKKRGVTKGSVVTYLGNDVDRFRANFGRLGVVKV